MSVSLTTESSIYIFTLVDKHKIELTLSVDAREQQHACERSRMMDGILIQEIKPRQKKIARQYGITREE
jgi:hypothetical protein